MYAIWNLTKVCPWDCSFCCMSAIKVGQVNGGESLNFSEKIKVLEILATHKMKIDFSGGDPLLLPDRRILSFVRAFARLPHIDAVRIGTRVPVTLPMRVTPVLARALGAFKKVWVNTQFNHAREITPEAAAACARLVEAGIPVSNQSVLLKGVNDSVGALFDLCTGLQRIRVRPYYVFLCDPVAGTAHFRVPLRRARRLERELAVRVGGLALPRFVMDIPGLPRKTPI